MNISFSITQHRRLKELGVAESQLKQRFNTFSQRDETFLCLASELVKQERRRLADFRVHSLRPGLCRLQSCLTDFLTGKGFVQVITPIIMTRSHLSRMSITADHPLIHQIYWIDQKHCLRPMLAPHLYCLLQNLLRVWEKPVRLFEVGPCFRKESGGVQHSREFTMLNLVEMGLPMEEREERMKQLASWIAEAAGLKDFELSVTWSEVYGESIDVLAGKQRLEVASGAIGPHVLDRAWKINEPWVGIGFGLERLLMAAGKGENISRLGPSLSYVNGIRLNI